MASCSFCNAKIPTTFLGKLIGTQFKDSEHKTRYACSNCQKEHKNKPLAQQLN